MAYKIFRIGCWCAVGALVLTGNDFEFVKGGWNWPGLFGYFAGTITGALLVTN